jgi:hypothetical protein
MLRRLLNIASVVCLVLCLTLFTMSVRSFFVLDGYLWARGDLASLNIYSLHGKIGMQQTDLRPHVYTQPSFYYAKEVSEESGDVYAFAKRRGGMAWLGFCRFSMGSGGTYFSVPYWFFVFVCGCLAMLLQLTWPPRFSTRQLFTATTFLAVVLGMIGWLDAAWIGK